MELKEEADSTDAHPFLNGLHRAARLEALLDLLADDGDFFHPAAGWIDKLGRRSFGGESCILLLKLIQKSYR
jgi:hypothetical protein